MSIKTQKIISFFPIVNFIVIIFVWLSFYFKHAMKMTRFLRNVLIIFLGMLVVNIPRVVLYYFVQSNVVDTIAYWISIYLTTLVISRIAIWDQEKY